MHPLDENFNAIGTIFGRNERIIVLTSTPMEKADLLEAIGALDHPSQPTSEYIVGSDPTSRRLFSLYNRRISSEEALSRQISIEETKDMNIIKVLHSGNANYTIATTIHWAIGLSKAAREIPVQFWFNGVKVAASANDDVDKLVKKYRADYDAVGSDFVHPDSIAPQVHSLMTGPGGLN